MKGLRFSISNDPEGVKARMIEVDLDALSADGTDFESVSMSGDVTITGDGLARVTPQDFSLNGKANTLNINGMDLYFGVESMKNLE